MKKISLGEVAKFINGRAFSPDEWGTIGLPIIRIQNLTGSSQLTNYYCGEFEKKHLVRRGDILISWSASLGVYIWAGNDAILNQHIFKVVPKESVDKLYFYYAASNALNEMISQVHGSTMQHITKDPFESTLIYLPSLSEQKRIAAILEKVDRLRRQRRYAMELSDTYLQTVFLGMFGDPVTNPKGWDIRSLINISQKFSDGPFGSNLKTEHYTNLGVRVIRLQNIGIGRLLDEDKAYISESHFAIIDKHRCLPGDVLVGTLGDPNLRACILPNSIPVALNKADCVQIRVNPDEATAEYVCWLLNMPHTLFMATGMLHGQTRTRINMGRLAELQVPIPPLLLQQKFAQIVQKYQRLRAQQREAERQAEHLFQTLLHSAFQGELELEKGAGDMPEEQAPYANATDLQYALTAPAKLVAEEMAQLVLPME